MRVVGGLGEGQAEVLSKIAGKLDSVFSTSAPSMTLCAAKLQPLHLSRRSQRGMYLDALIDWYTGLGHNRWFIVHEDTEAGAALHRRALEAFGRGNRVQKLLTQQR
jgi:ABC-type uncharacterized transport system YnjBCD ATPase subunit